MAAINPNDFWAVGPKVNGITPAIGHTYSTIYAEGLLVRHYGSCWIVDRDAR